jgi:hypothetical protein
MPLLWTWQTFMSTLRDMVFNEHIMLMAHPSRNCNSLCDCRCHWIVMPQESSSQWLPKWPRYNELLPLRNRLKCRLWVWRQHPSRQTPLCQERATTTDSPGAVSLIFRALAEDRGLTRVWCVLGNSISDENWNLSTVLQKSSPLLTNLELNIYRTEACRQNRIVRRAKTRRTRALADMLQTNLAHRPTYSQEIRQAYLYRSVEPRLETNGHSLGVCDEEANDRPFHQKIQIGR